MMLFTSKWSLKLSMPHSRPSPLSPTPPQGEAGSRRWWSLIQTMPALTACGHPVGAGDVARAHGRGEAERRVVGEPQRVRLVLEAGDAGERPEHLLLEDAHVGAHVGEDGGLDEVAALEARHLRGPAARDRARALVAAVARIGQHPVALALAEMTGPSWVAGSKGSPRRIEAVLAASRSTNSS